VEERVAALREIFPLLPLRDTHALFTEKGTRGVRVVPWIQYYVCDVNLDDVDRIATILGTDPMTIHAQLDAFFEAYRAPSLLETRDALEGIPSLTRVFDFAQFARHHDSEGPATALWWTLCLPVLAPSRTTALVRAQIGGNYGAEDFYWLARRTGESWRLEALDLI